VNSLATFGKNKAKQFLAVNHDGYVIADAILFGFDDDHYSLVGTPVAPNWVAYHAEAGGYDVEVTRDERTPANPNQERLTFRYQLNGPATGDIVAKAHGGPLDHIKFFQMGEFTIASHPVRALNHTMSGVPGREMTGLEIIGHAEDRDAVLAALLQAGQEFGLRRGGVRSYISATYESGWIPSPTPAIYSGEETRAYRQWLSAMTLEGHASIGAASTRTRSRTTTRPPGTWATAGSSSSTTTSSAGRPWSGSPGSRTGARSGSAGTPKT
jgi:hypothetical protein